MIDASPGDLPSGESPIIFVGQSAIVVIPNTCCNRKHEGDSHPEQKLGLVEENPANPDIHHGKTDGVTPFSSVIIVGRKKLLYLAGTVSLGNNVSFSALPMVQSKLDKVEPEVQKTCDCGGYFGGQFL